MKTNSTPPAGYIVIQPGPGPYDRECADILHVLKHALDPDEKVSIHNGQPGNAQAVRDLHQRQPDADYCDLCSNHGDIDWPCATIRALDRATEK
ncbi:hypothetical protein [Streptomyces rochei]|uniref:hypothetical protein n=1 Tax=Streptomyces rochei TaxID=1928 RepID=UPI004062DDFC